MKKDDRYKKIGSLRRAASRYYMMLNRVNNSHNPRNSGYEGVKIMVNKDDFVAWFMERDFEGCSVDRIDKNGDYCFENMQVIPMTLNNAKDRIIAHDGNSVCYACNQTKGIDEFVDDKRRMFVKKSTICKDCERKRAIEKAKIYRSIPENVEKGKIRCKEYYKRKKDQANLISQQAGP